MFSKYGGLGEIVDLDDKYTTTEFLLDDVPTDRQVWRPVNNRIKYPELDPNKVWVSNMGGVMIVDHIDIIDGVPTPVPSKVNYCQNSIWAEEAVRLWGSIVYLCRSETKLYPSIVCNKKQYFIHVLVAITFTKVTDEWLINSCSERGAPSYVVSHLNENKGDARAINLQCTTQTINQKHNGLAAKRGKNKECSTTWCAYNRISGKLEYYGTLKEIAATYGIARETVVHLSDTGVAHIKSNVIFFSVRTYIRIPCNIDVARAIEDGKLKGNKFSTSDKKNRIVLYDYISKYSPYITLSSEKSRSFFSNLITGGSS